MSGRGGPPSRKHYPKKKPVPVVSTGQVNDDSSEQSGKRSSASSSDDLKNELNNELKNESGASSSAASAERVRGKAWLHKTTKVETQQGKKREIITTVEISPISVITHNGTHKDFSNGVGRFPYSFPNYKSGKPRVKMCNHPEAAIAASKYIHIADDDWDVVFRYVNDSVAKAKEIQSHITKKDVFKTRPSEKLPSVDPEWNNIKLDVMRKVLTAKFAHSKELGEKLVSIQDVTFVYNVGDSKYWGAKLEAGADKYTGENRVGLILGEIRKEIKIQLENQKRYDDILTGKYVDAAPMVS